MHNEFTAIVEQDGPWYVSYCAEMPGANGQGKRVKNACPIFARRSPLCWSIGARNLCVPCLPMRGRNSS